MNPTTVVAFGIAHLSPYARSMSVCLLILAQNAKGVLKPLGIGSASASVDVIGVSYSQILGVSMRSQYRAVSINSAVSFHWATLQKSDAIPYRVLRSKILSSFSRLLPDLKGKCHGPQEDHQNQ